MKSRIKITRHKEDNSTLVNYFNHKNAISFRYKLLKKLLQDVNEEFVIIIDTNRKLREIQIEEIESVFSQKEIEFLKSPVKSTKKRILGLQFLNFRRNKKEDFAHVLFFKLDSSQFTETFFNEFLYNFDLAIGIEPQKELTEIQALYLVDYNHVLFNDETFLKTIYDSAIFSQLRASFNIEPLVKSMS